MIYKTDLAQGIHKIWSWTIIVPVPIFKTFEVRQILQIVACRVALRRLESPVNIKEANRLIFMLEGP